LNERVLADHEQTRVAWDQLAAVHGQDAYYDSEALLAGASSFIEEEEHALLQAVGATLAGRRVLHLQCHIGFDAITFARRGAHVTAVDFSQAALEKARCLADRCGIRVDWIQADALRLPDSLHNRFDLIWATMGIVCWIADLSAWMRAAAGALAPGGKLVLIDGHPGERLLDDTSAIGHAPIRRVIDAGWDYATPSRTGPQVQFKYSLAAINAAAVSAGLRVQRLIEHDGVSSDLCVPTLKREPDGQYRNRVNGRLQPVLFTLIAEREAEHHTRARRLRQG
jgi:SAM-dependent methyltransferase